MHRNAKAKKTQMLYFKRKSALDVFASDSRHSYDQEKNYMTFHIVGHVMIDEKGAEIYIGYMEIKGLRHDCIMWSEVGHAEVRHRTDMRLEKADRQ